MKTTLRLYNYYMIKKLILFAALTTATAQAHPRQYHYAEPVYVYPPVEYYVPPSVYYTQPPAYYSCPQPQSYYRRPAYNPRSSQYSHQYQYAPSLSFGFGGGSSRVRVNIPLY